MSSWMCSIRRSMVAAVGIACFSVVVLPSCSKRDNSAPVVQAIKAMNEAERERAAEEGYKKARQATFPEKAALLTDVVRTFWDTRIAPKALSDLVIALFDEHMLDPATALKEIEVFMRRRPGERETLAAVTIYSHAIDKLIDEHKDDPKFASAGELKKKAATYWRERAIEASKTEAGAKDFEILQVLGQALFANDDFTGAESAWAKVEELSPAPIAIRRFETLMWRGDLQDAKLGDPARALSLFEKAQSISKDLDLNADEKWGGYVRKRIEELKAKLSKN